MNDNQKVALGLGLAAFLALAVWPPPDSGPWGSASFIDSPLSRQHVHWPALAVLWLVVAVLTAGAVLLFGRRRD